MNDHGTRGIAVAFGSSALASLGLTVTYALGGQPQIEGSLLAIALGGIALGLVLWAHAFLPGGDRIEERAFSLGDAQAREGAFEAAEVRGGDVDRRRFLARALGAAAAALGLAAVIPVRSLGQRPGESLLRTAWSAGARAVTPDGLPVRPDDLGVGGIATVFPDGHVSAADSQAVLIRLAAGGDDDAEGLVAFSKICTHAGCPVGLYQPTTEELFCPCHQSVFDAGDGARPTAGPATRPLPRLGLAVDDEGYVIATGDFSEPVGPGFFTRDA